MNTVTLTELRRNLESYLNKARTGDVIITKYGREVARLVSTAASATTEDSNSSTNATAEDETPASANVASAA